MGILTKARSWLAGALLDDAYRFREDYESRNLRARPGQEIEKAHMMYMPGSVQPYVVAQYALSEWVYTAISRLAEMASIADLKIVGRDDPTKTFDNHPLLDLIGLYGTPNDAQDTYEFYEQHFAQLELAGNVYWWWRNPLRGGAPVEVFILDPTKIQIIPGRDRTIGAFEYDVQGRKFMLTPEEVTHFKRPSPYSLYYGISAIEVLMRVIEADRKMLKWNSEFFSSGIPSGVMVIDESVSNDELERVDREWNLRHADRRRVGFVRAKAGSTVWVDAGAKHRDMEFKEGRTLSRQTVFDALGLHVGLLSEASTEAHARVAERRVLETVWMRHQKTASRLNTVLGFWPLPSNKAARFVDVRRADWQQEAMKLTALRQYMTRNEVRSRELDLKPIPEWDAQDIAPVQPVSDGGNDDAPESD